MNASASITTGNSRYDVAASNLRVTLTCLPGVGVARIRVPSDLSFSASVGDDALVSLSHDNIDNQVLTGSIRSIQYRFHTIEITIADDGALLNQFRPATTYEALSADAIVQSLAGDAGVDVSRSDSGPDLPYYTAHQGRTAGEHIAFLGALAGCIASFDGEGALAFFTVPTGTPEKALLYGRELIEYNASLHPVPEAQFVVAGTGPAGSVSAPDVLIPSFDRLPGNAPAAGTSARWKPTSALRIPAAASQANDAINQLAGMYTQRIDAVCFMQSDLRPGAVIEVQEVPGAASGGPWLLTNVEHVFDGQRGAWTHFSGISTEGGGLLGSLLGLAGGLF